MIGTPPPAGYAYQVIETLDTNTGKLMWIVALKPTFWQEYWKQVIGAVTTAVIGLGGWMFKNRITELFSKGG